MPINERIEQLHTHLSQIVYWLKQQNKNRFGLNFFNKYLYAKNWTLVIGTTHSGKTSLLQQAELNVLQGQIEDSTECSTWFNQEGVFIELPTLSLQHPEDNHIIHDFIRTIKTFRRKKPFDNILLTINLYTCMQEYNQYIHYLELLKEQLLDVLGNYCTSQTTLTIIFTHMDKVAGFCDFFSSFTEQHTTSALGYLVDDYSSPKKLMEQHEKKYDRLLSRLHEHLIVLLHKTRNNLTRYLIREFPQQLDSLRNIVRSTLFSLSDTPLKIKGVFFTSARQSGVSVDRLTTPISESYHLTLPHHFPQASRAQPYFIKALFQIIAKTSPEEDTRFAHYQKEHKIAAYVGYTFVGLLFLLMGFYYQHTAQRIDTATQALQQYQQLTQKTSIDALLPELTYLAQARHTLDGVHSWFVPFKNLHKTQRWVNHQYHQELEQQFLPRIARSMEDYLMTNRDPQAQYATLKAYLMLGQPAYLDVGYLNYWLRHYLHFPTKTSLESSLLLPFPAIELNVDIISQVRSNLNALPPQYLAYLLMKEKPIHWISLHNTAFNVSTSSRGIPHFYTRSAFEEEYTSDIPHAAHQFQQEAWILKNPLSSHVLLSELTDQIRELYTTDYANWWRLFIYHTQPQSFHTLKEAQAYFQLLTQSSSPLLRMLALIQSNIQPFKTPNPIQKIFNTQIADHLQSIKIAENIEQSSEKLRTLFPTLDALNRYFTIMASKPNASAFIYNTVKQKFSQGETTHAGALDQLFETSNGIPAPVGTWLKHIAANSWSLILGEARQYIQQQWKSQVISVYQQTIMNRFPIDVSSKQDISLADFSRFFGPQGVLNTFFQSYIQPFLDTRTAEWVPKKINEFTLPFSVNMIREFERANVIREMFFPSHTQIQNQSMNATTTPIVHFAIQPMALQPVVAAAVLNIQGTSISASQSEKETQYFVWPSQQPELPVTFAIHSITGENVETTEYGPWGFFRLLTQANIQPVQSDSTTLQFMLDLNDNAVQYLLKTDNPVNPFTPNVISGFKLEDLF